MNSAMTKIIHYFDYKSPYAYLAQEDVFRLHTDTSEAVEWLPYTLDIPSFLGAAELDDSGNDSIQTRNDHQWRRVRYSYMDCRREANRRGLTIRGPQKVFDSSIAHIGFLYAKKYADKNSSIKLYHRQVFEQFWQRKLDIEEPSMIVATLNKAGINTDGFIAYLNNEGAKELKDLQHEAEARGVFGVPSYLVGDELFWGREHITQIRALLGLGQ